MRIVAMDAYVRRARRLLTAAERAAAEAEIAAQPAYWPIVPGLAGARKARVAFGGRGKSGGARIIYYHMVAPGVVVLIAIYAKNEKEDLNNADRKAIRAAVAELRAAADDTAG